MAGLIWNVRSTSIATGTSTKTLLQITAPTNQRVKLREWSISFDGTVNTNTPILVQIYRCSTAGTGTDVTPVKQNSADDETIQTTAKSNFTAEPGVGDILREERVHPQGSGYTWPSPYLAEVHVPGGTRLGCRVVTPAQDVNAVVNFLCEE